MRKIAGLTLISLIVGVTLSSIVFMALSGVFSSSRGNQSLANALSELNNLAKNLQKNVNDLSAAAGNMVPDGTTGLYPTLANAFVETNYASAPGGVAPANGVVLGYFNYNSSNENLWFKAYGNANGLIRSCLAQETATGEDFRIILFTQTSNQQTGFYCAKQSWGQTAQAAMQNPVELIPPSNFDSVWLKFGLTALYVGCYADNSTTPALSYFVNASGSIVNTGSPSYSYSLATCQQLAQQNGYSFFALQNGATANTAACYLGNSYNNAIGYGASNACTSPQQGGNQANALYSVNGVISKWVDPVNLSTYIDQTTGLGFTTLNVQAIRYAFLIKSSDPVLPLAQTQNFEFMNLSGSNKITRNSKYLYKLVEFTVPLVYNQLHSSVN